MSNLLKTIGFFLCLTVSLYGVLMVREDRRAGTGRRYMSVFQCFEGAAWALYVRILSLIEMELLLWGGNINVTIKANGFSQPSVTKA